jgi:hypothetical protein
MQPIAHNLTKSQIEAVAAYLNLKILMTPAELRGETLDMGH